MTAPPPRSGSDRAAAKRTPPERSVPERTAARLLTGPVGHLAGAAIDWLELLARLLLARARGRDPWA